MKNTVQTQTRSNLVGQLLGGLEQGITRREAGALRYRLLKVRGQMAHLQPITETGDAKAIADYRHACQVEKDLSEKFEAAMSVPAF